MKKKKHSTGCICKQCLLSTKAQKSPLARNPMVQANKAIEEVCSDTTVPKDETIDRLQELRDMINEKLESLSDY